MTTQTRNEKLAALGALLMDIINDVPALAPVTAGDDDNDDDYRDEADDEQESPPMASVELPPLTGEQVAKIERLFKWRVHMLRRERRDEAEQEVRAAVSEKFGRVECLARTRFDELSEYVAGFRIKPEWVRDPANALAELQDAIDRIDPIPEQMGFREVSELSDWTEGFLNSLHGLGFNATKLERAFRAQRVAMVRYWTIANEASSGLHSAAETIERSAGILAMHQKPVRMHRD